MCLFLLFLVGLFYSVFVIYPSLLRTSQEFPCAPSILRWVFACMAMVCCKAMWARHVGKSLLHGVSCFSQARALRSPPVALCPPVRCRRSQEVFESYMRYITCHLPESWNLCFCVSSRVLVMSHLLRTPSEGHGSVRVQRVTAPV